MEQRQITDCKKRRQGTKIKTPVFSPAPLWGGIDFHNIFNVDENLGWG